MRVYIQFYINCLRCGRLILQFLFSIVPLRSSRSRHLVVTIHNVSKYMQVVGCEAENSKNRDYKETKLNVQFAPVVSKVTQHTNTTNIQGKGKIIVLLFQFSKFKVS